MKHFRPLLFLLLSLSFASLGLASPVAYTNIPVTCKEFVPNIETETLTVTVDPMLNGGTITAGNKATDDCYFSISGHAISSPFASGDFNFTSPLDIVCWHTGGFCVSGSTLMKLNISPVSGGSLFTLVASSITTTFILPDGTTGGGGGGGGVVPEPGSMVLMGSGLIFLGLYSRKRARRS